MARKRFTAWDWYDDPDYGVCMIRYINPDLFAIVAQGNRGRSLASVTDGNTRIERRRISTLAAAVAWADGEMDKRMPVTS